MARPSLKSVYDVLMPLREQTDWYIQKKETRLLEYVSGNNTYKLYFSYIKHGISVKELALEGYSNIYSKLKELLDELSEAQDI